MISNYLTLAFRNLAKYRLYAFINIVGLALGLILFLFSMLIASYEKNHDAMFAKREQIFTVGSVFAPSARESIREFPNVRTAYGPIFQAEIKEAKHIARAIHRRVLLTTEKENQHESIRFVDTDFIRIFDFKYIHGNESALDDLYGFIATESMANGIFGHTDVMGKSVSTNHKQNMHVSAVIKDIAGSSILILL